MMEVIVLLCNIGPLASARFKIATVVYTLADEVGTARAQRQKVATNTNTMTITLRQLKTIVNVLGCEWHVLKVEEQISCSPG
jgi:DNA-binding Xre family transcriptional regulator